MTKIMIVGNWKMHLNVAQSSLLVHRLNLHIKAHRDVEVVLAPSMLGLQPLSREIDRRKFRLAAQNAYHKDEGAYTGEVSFTMLRGLVHYAIIGHSERRLHFGESLEVVRDKVAACIRNGISPIVCVGESHEERRTGETRQVLHDQLITALHGLTAEEVANTVIAYEPVWAIGSGVSAKPREIEDAVSYIRHNIEELYGGHAAGYVRVLYGAGVEPEFVQGILSLNCKIDGLLVGGASLNYVKFAAIVASSHRLAGKA